jgi:NAD-dependent SIR2 family protein deacetylase
MSESRIAFLLGAGISAASGLPKTNEITGRILSKDGLSATKRRITIEYPDKSVRLKEEPFDNDIIEFLNKLYPVLDKYNIGSYWSSENKESKRHKVNYEDLFFALNAIQDHLYGDFNPFGAMLEEKTEFQKLKEHRFLIRVARYMSFNIIRMLDRRAVNYDAFKTIFEVCRHQKLTATDVFSLNHDLLLEEAIDSTGLKFIDGFGDKDGDIRKWIPELFDSPVKGSVRLLKLHGAINWRYFAVDSTTPPKPQLGIYIGPHDIDRYIVEIKDSSGTKYLYPTNPGILIGTENKVNEYQHLHFWELHYRFRKFLRENDCLVVIGYSFGDSAITGQILEWLQNEDGKRMIVVDNKDKHIFAEELQHDLRWRKDWEWLIKNGKVKYFGNGIERFSCDDI